jgi:hypothetical protein
VGFQATAAVAFSIVFTVSACSGGSGHPSAVQSSSLSSTTTAPQSTTTSSIPVADYASAAEVVQALGAKGLACKSETPLSLSESDLSYVQTATMCTIDGEDVVIATFKSARQRATYETIGEQGRGAYPHWVLGTTWAIATLTRATADRIAAAIGGTPH